MPNPDSDALLNEAEAARFLNISPRTLQAWRSRGFGPPFVRIGRAIRYRRCDLEQWASAGIVEHRSPTSTSRPAR
jgi:hypothetical protein